MLFRPLASPRSVRWRAVDGEGVEHLTIEPSEGGYRVRSSVVGSQDGRDYGAFYSMVIDGTFVRVVSWYDNEWGFSNRMADTAVAMAKLI